MSPSSLGADDNIFVKTRSPQVTNSTGELFVRMDEQGVQIVDAP
jgi:hypothetical protein